MTWIDGSRWDPDRGRELTDLLIQAYTTEGATLAVIDRVGLKRDVMPTASTVGVRWIELSRAMHEARVLRKVAELLASEKPVLAARVTELAADPPEARELNPEGLYEVQLLLGRRPLIDRTDLRSTLRQFLENEIPLFVIRGKPRIGKTYSLEFLQHVTRHGSDLLVIDVNFAPVANGDNAAALIAKICRLVDVEEVAPDDGRTTRIRQAIALVDLFVGRYRNRITDLKHRLIVIDGLNRTDLQDDVHKAVAYLADQVIRGRLPRTQLVLTGYAGTLDPELDYGYLTEDVSPITEAHVRFYFEHLVLAGKLSKEKVDELVRKAQVGQGDVRALGSRVRGLTLELMEVP